MKKRANPIINETESTGDNSKLTVLHVITSLENGGAQSLLYETVCRSTNFNHIVISLHTLDDLGKKMLAEGHEVIALNMPRGRITLQGIKGYCCILRNRTPNIIQCWMYHANLFGGVIAKLSGQSRIFWSIHNTTLNKAGQSFSLRIVNRISALLSGVIPLKIISCSQSGTIIHQKFGYKKEKLLTVYNGYDEQTFKTVLATNKLDSSNRIIRLGMVARYHPQKDHLNLITALGILAKKSDIKWNCKLAGQGVTTDNKVLLGAIKERHLTQKIQLLGPQNPIQEFYHSIDLHILPSSSGEAFPNVVNETMLCEIPNVATDVGDTALIVGKLGWIVEPSNPDALATAILAACELFEEKSDWTRLKQNCRQRICENFSINKMLSSYEIQWTKRL